MTPSRRAPRRRIPAHFATATEGSLPRCELGSSRTDSTANPEIGPQSDIPWRGRRAARVDAVGEEITNISRSGSIHIDVPVNPVCP